MNFEEAYKQLEEKFKQRVVEDYNPPWKFESVFLPNVAPKGPVDYILIAMEPSLKGWAQDNSGRTREDKKGVQELLRRLALALFHQ